MGNPKGTFQLSTFSKQAINSYFDYFIASVWLFTCSLRILNIAAHTESCRAVRFVNSGEGDWFLYIIMIHAIIYVRTYYIL